MDRALHMHLPVNTAHVWRFPLIAARQEIKALTHWLGPLERRSLERLAHSKDRDCKTVAWGRLRYILSRYMDCMPESLDLEREPSGRPRIANSHHGDLTFSLAHSGTLGVVGIARHAIGVDVERLRQTTNIDRLATRFFSVREAESLARRPAKERVPWFFRLWVLKEAAMKSTGGRVPADLSKYEIEWASSGPSLARQDPLLEQHARTLVEIPVSIGYVAALAVSPEVTDAKVFDL